jgi:sulfate transport system permease protein
LEDRRLASSVASVALPRLRALGFSGEKAAGAFSLGFIVLYLSIVVALPLAAVASASSQDGWSGFWNAISNPEAVAALKLSLAVSFIATLVNAVLGTLTAWVLVRDDFRGKSFVNAVIDLPFALPTIVAGLVLLVLYGPRSPVGVHLAFTRWAIFMALLFVTLPFVVRTVQPVLHELDTEMEEAARSLGAGETTVFRRVVLPNILPGILSGIALAFARAVGEIGSLVLVTGNNPFKTEVASVYVFNQIQSGNQAGASAVAVVLLLISFAVLLLVGGIRWRATRHERA